jgi:hypothetical protein
MSLTANATWRIPAAFAGAYRLSPWIDGEWNGVELRQLESSVAVRSLHHRNVRPYALEPHDAVYPATFDCPLALQHESELDEELSGGCEVVNHNADVLHPLDTHTFDGKEPDSGRACRAIVTLDHTHHDGGTFEPRLATPSF